MGSKRLEIASGAPFSKAEVDLGGLPHLIVYAATGNLEEAQAMCRLCLLCNQGEGVSAVGVAHANFPRVSGGSETPLAPRSDIVLHMLGKRPIVESDERLIARLTTKALCLASKS